MLFRSALGDRPRKRTDERPDGARALEALFQRSAGMGLHGFENQLRD